MNTLLPLVDLVRLHAPLRAELEAAFARVLASGRYHLGPETVAFEAEFAAAEGGGHGVGCGSGSDALFLALRALDVGPGDAVVTVSNSFMATPESVVRTGADVLFAEPDPRSRCLDPADLARLLREPGAERVRVVLPVHLYGRQADVRGIREVLDDAGRHDVRIVGDAAQAHGSPGCGAATDLTCWSFYPAKNLGALGDAGFVLAQDPAIADRVRSLRNHGRAGKHSVREIGLNSRFDELTAAGLRVKLPHLPRWNAERRAVADAYRSRLGSLDDVSIGPADGARLVLPEDSPEHVHHLFVVEVVGDRAATVAALRDRGIDVGQHYPVAVHRMPPYPSARPLPVTEALCASVLSLPIFPGMRLEEVERVCDAVIDVLALRRPRPAPTQTPLGAAS